MTTTLTGVLFDLDGTLLDTAPDMHGALTRLMQEHGREPLPFREVRDHVSHGSRALVQLGFPDVDGPASDRLKQRFLDIYAEYLCLATRLFPGMEEALIEMEGRGLLLGVVTNKPGWLTRPLLDALGLTSRFATIVSGDTLPERKPSPEPMRYAARQAGGDPRGFVYIGDAERDIAAGRAAGMHTLVAGWGYIDAGENTQSWAADAELREPADFWFWFERLRGGSRCLAS
jgi:N-acetyl-D-muramate 6-phosphate phosphatase